MTCVNGCGLRCVTLKDVSVKRGRENLISGVSMELRCGEITAIIGANGAGKTTLIRAVLGDIPHTGKVCFSDHNANEVSGIKIGYVPQHLSFDISSPVSVLDLFATVGSRRPAFFGSGAKRSDNVGKALKNAGCDHLARRRLGELSGGELQRIMLALALDPVPDLLILDEPVSGVDAGGLEQFYNTVSKLRQDYHMAIVLISHDLAPVAKYADNVALLSGRLLECGTPREVYETPAFKQIFGNPVVLEGE